MGRKPLDLDHNYAGKLVEPVRRGAVAVKMELIPELVTWLTFCKRSYLHMMLDTEWTNNLSIHDRYMVEIRKGCIERARFIDDLIGRVYDKLSIVEWRTIYLVVREALEIHNKQQLNEYWDAIPEWDHGGGI